MAIIHIIQKLHTNGKEAEIPVEITDDLKKTADMLKIIVDVIADNHIRIRAIWKGETEQDMLMEYADLISKDNSPIHALERLIRRFQPKPFKPFLE